MNKALYLIAAYALIAMLTFGFAFNNQPPTKQVFGRIEATNDADRFFIGALSGIFWPLYLSVKIFEKQPEGKS